MENKNQKEIDIQELKDFLEVQRLLLKKEIQKRNFDAFEGLTEDENMKLLRFAGFEI